MTKSILWAFSCLLLLILISAQGSTSPEQRGQIQPVQPRLVASESPEHRGVSSDFGQIPLYFIRNEGQVDSQALYYAKASGYTLWLTKQGLIFDSVRETKKEGSRSPRLGPRDPGIPDASTYERDVSRLQFLNSSMDPEVIPLDLTDYRVNYFIGNDDSKWRTNIQTSKAVLYRDLYPNIDLKVYGVGNRIEYDFIVKPGGDVSEIGYEYSDVERTRIDRDGNLIIKTEFGELTHVRPECYQVIGEEKVEVGASFRKSAQNGYGIDTEAYDNNHELIIDPLVIVYSTYLGSTVSDGSHDIAVDSTGAAYVTGYTGSMDFPILNPFQASQAGDGDVFITKINASGSSLVFSTFLGGSGWDRGFGIGVDDGGAIYVTGSTRSTDFPIKNPIQENKMGTASWEDAFVAKINTSGSDLAYSTYLGGSDWDYGVGISVDQSGAAYVAGTTLSDDFPLLNPIKGYNQFWDIFISKIDPSGTELVYSTYLGGTAFKAEYWEYLEECTGIAADSEGAVYVTGYTITYDFPTLNPIQENKAGRKDAFITKINPSGTSLVYSTYLGGTSSDYSFDIAVDSVGAAYVTGYTESSDFPTHNPIQDGYMGRTDTFIAKIDPSGTSLVYSTYLGGSDVDRGRGITVGKYGAAYVTGETSSTDFPILNPFQSSNAGDVDVFLTKINSLGTALVYSTYLGGSDWEGGYSIGIAVDSVGGAYITGQTESTDFPTLNPIKKYEAAGNAVFITKICSTYSLSISSGKGGTTNPPPGTYIYDCGSKVDIEAFPSPRYRFFGWSGDISSVENPITLTMDSDKSINADFIRQYRLRLASGAGGTTNPQPGVYLYDAGAEISLTAVPDTHFQFSHWSGDVSGSENPIKITMDSDMSVMANFLRIIYAPLSFTGQKVENRSLFQAEYINILNWQANPNNIDIVKYRIYQIEGENRNLLSEVSAGTFEQWYRGVEKDKTYRYDICAVNAEGREGQAAIITIE